MDKRLVRRSLFVALMGAFGVSGATLAAVVEIEPNNGSREVLQQGREDLTRAQMLDAEAEIVVNGALVNAADVAYDADIYAFEVTNAGDMVSIDMSSAVDTNLTLLGPAPTYALIATNDDRDFAGGDFNASIQNAVLTEPGTYVVIVSTTGVFFSSGGLFTQMPRMTGNGPYTMTITGLTPSAPTVPQPDFVQIEIRPGSGKWSGVVNARSNGIVPVALFSSQSFEAPAVDISSIRFGATGDEKSLKRCGAPVDINGDGLPDLMCHFHAKAMNLKPEHEEAILRGRTVAGKDFQAIGPLKVVEPWNKAKDQAGEKGIPGKGKKNK